MYSPKASNKFPEFLREKNGLETKKFATSKYSPNIHERSNFRERSDKSSDQIRSNKRSTMMGSNDFQKPTQWSMKDIEDKMESSGHQINYLQSMEL